MTLKNKCSLRNRTVETSDMILTAALKVVLLLIRANLIVIILGIDFHLIRRILREESAKSQVAMLICQGK